MPTSGDRVSDVKTVTYYMASAAALPAGLAGSPNGPKSSGLLRRESDRALGVWSRSSGGSGASVGPVPEALAPEVAGISFRYFDGQSWQPSWDSRQRVGLPKAVEIEVAFLAGSLDETGGAASALVDLREKVTHKLVVSPAGWRPPNAYSTYYQQVNGQIPSTFYTDSASATSR
ncbi:MAG TPA: hypothetical protein VMV69_09010 [Pirellulales bacterium]|nr:hypothetical protein [Pirellulales bacterium]